MSPRLSQPLIVALSVVALALGGVSSASLNGTVPALPAPQEVANVTVSTTAPSAAPEVTPSVAPKEVERLINAPASETGNKPRGSITVEEKPPLLPPCETDADCSGKFGPHAACIDHWCGCAHGSQYDASFTKKCVLNRNALDQSCKLDADCRLTNSYCKAERCHCRTGFTFNGNRTKCLPMASVDNNVCEEPLQCVIYLNSSAGSDGAATCKDGKCACREGYEFANSHCLRKQGRGGKCSNDDECGALENGACIQEVCECKEQFVPAAVLINKCLPRVTELSGVCSEQIQCTEGLGELSVCSGGKCACVDGAQLNGTKCACASGLEVTKGPEPSVDKTRCEKPMPIKQGAVKQEGAGGNGGASALPSVAVSSLLAAVLCLTITA